MKLRSDFAHLPIHEVGRGAAASGEPIVITCSKRYELPAQVAAASLLVNSPTRDFELVILATGWQEGDRLDDFDRLGKRFGAALTVLRADEVLLPDAFAARYIPRSNFFRLMLADMIDCDRLVHLNADLVVQTDITDIWQEFQPTDLVGGVPDRSARNWKRTRGFVPPDLYLNTGVLLINCEAWRTQHATALCADWMRDNQADAILGDQDAINGALRDETYEIPAHWNVTRNELRRQPIVDIRQPRDADGFVGIFQFDGPSPKPWCRWADPFSQEIYGRYAHVIGLPPDHWIEARNPREALAEARWAERQGNIVKANEIYRRIIQTALSRPNEQGADGGSETDRTQAAAGLAD